MHDLVQRTAPSRRRGRAPGQYSSDEVDGHGDREDQPASRRGTVARSRRRGRQVGGGRAAGAAAPPCSRLPPPRWTRRGGRRWARCRPRSARPASRRRPARGRRRSACSIEIEWLAASSRPRKTPGKTSTLLIWLGKSLRPLATTAACSDAADRVDLGDRVGQGEDDAALGHGGDVVAGQDVRSRHPDEDVGTGQHVAQRAGAARRRWCARRPTRSSAARSWRPAWITPSLSPTTTCCAPASSSTVRMAMPAAPAPDSTIRTSGERLADDLQRVDEGGEHHDRGAVLVVVEDRDVQAGPQPALDLEAPRRRDVLEVDARRRPGRSARPSARSRRRPGCPGRWGRRRSPRTA